MKCKACKNTVPDGSLFCMFCGEKLVKTKAQKEKEASIPKPRQQKSGDWIGQIMVDGKRHTVKGRTIREYEAKAKALKTGIIEARDSRHMSLEAAIDDFISSQSNLLSPSTLRSYKSLAEHRFQHCMTWDIYEENPWQKAINEEIKAVSSKTVHNAWRLITAALRAQNASVPTVKLPAKAKAERPWLDYKQIDIFLDAIKGHPAELSALLALHSLRLSELIAVRPEDVNLVTDTIYITGTRVLNDNGELVYKPIGKTSASLRSVPIVIPRLKELLTPDVMALEYISDTYEKRLYDQINKVCKSAGLPLVGVHGLRHSFASLAYHLDWTRKSTMTVGGWTNSRVVDEIYTHNADLVRDIRKMKRHYKKTQEKPTEK